MQKRLVIFLCIVIFLISGCTNVSKPDESPPPQDEQIPVFQNDPAENPPDTFLQESGAAETIQYHDISSITVLVNKQNELPADFVPPDLVEVNIPFTFKEKADRRQLRQEAAASLEELFADAKNNSVILYGVSGYRSYQTQKTLFAGFTQRYGSEEEANQISARPGESEHQTGLAMDVTSQSVNFGLEEKFGNTSEYSWLIQNAHRFGFIIRYPKGKEVITGYTYEPWHLRYIGTDLATTLYEENLTYEEYLYFRI